MTHVSKYKLSKKNEKQLIDTLNIVLSSISKHEEMATFLSTFLSDTEKLMLAKRLAIIVLITEDIPDSQISSILHVTRITVAKMRYFYEARGQEGYGIALKKIASDKKLQQFKKVLLALTRYSLRAAGGYVTPKIFD